MASPSYLQTERLEILRSLSQDEQALLVPDPYLQWKLKDLLVRIGQTRPADEDIYEELFKELKKLQTEYGPSVLRALLDYGYLLYRDGDIYKLILPVVKDVIEAGRVNDSLLDAMIREVERYSYTPFWPTREIVKSLIRQLININNGVARHLLSNENLNFEIALYVVERIAEEHHASCYPDVIAFTKRVCSGTEKGAFFSRIRPLGRSLAKFGIVGIDLLAPVFDKSGLGPHGHTIFAAFGTDFCEWFLKSRPRRCIWWARAAFFACLKAQFNYKNRIARILLNDWASTDGEMAGVLRELLEAESPRRPRFLGTFSPDVQTLIKEFVGPYVPPPKPAEIVRATAAPKRAWERFISGLPNQRSVGKAAAEAFVKGGNDAHVRILEWLRAPRRGRMRSAFYPYVLSEERFLRLQPSTQMQILRSPHFREHASRSGLLRLLQAGADLDSRVSSRLQAEARSCPTRDVAIDDQTVVFR